MNRKIHAEVLEHSRCGLPLLFTETPLSPNSTAPGFVTTNLKADYSPAPTHFPKARFPHVPVRGSVCCRRRLHSAQLCSPACPAGRGLHHYPIRTPDSWEARDRLSGSDRPSPAKVQLGGGGGRQGAGARESRRPSSVLSRFSKSCPPSLQPYTWATSSNTVLYPLYPLPEDTGTCLANSLLVEVGMIIPASKPAPPQMAKVQLIES